MSLKDRLQLDAEPLYLVDGSSFLYRAFYAYPDLKRSDGFPTNALYIVLRILLKIIREEQPHFMAFFLDGKGKTFRNEIYSDYKAQRPRMPEALELQIKPLLEGVRELGIHAEVSEQGEADDSIASLARQYKNSRPVVIVGSDKDLFQCLEERRVVLWDPGQRTEKVVTEKDFREQTGLDTDQWPDYQALVGDSSDNIPGVPGIGPKTAGKLLGTFRSLEQLREHLDELAPKERNKLEPHLDEAFVYRRLTRLRTDFHPMEPLSTFRRTDLDPEGFKQFLQRYEFRTLISELEQVLGKSRGEEKPAAASLRVDRELDLARLSGRDAGVVPGEQGEFWLGLEEEEYLDTWPVDELVTALSRCRMVSLPSFKELLESDPAWERLPIARCRDIGLAAYLLNPEERNYSWPRIFQAHLSETGLHAENQGLGALVIGRLLERRLADAGLDRLMASVEMPLVTVLVHMQERGVAIDRDAFAGFLEEVKQELESLERSICEQAGQHFNLRSSRQLAEVLFDRLKLKPGRKTPGGVPSTASPVLEGLRGQHGIIADILRYRILEKLRSTYLEPLPKMVGADGRLHTTFNQQATATGRLSSSNPNLQNIPIRGEFGSRMRSCFVAGTGHSIVAADYSQIELRILAHMSQEPNLVEAFQRDEDIHSRTAALLFDTDPGSVAPGQRRKAKTINFGLLYGMGPQKLAGELGITMSEAKSFIEIYFSRLGKVSAFYEDVETWARQYGYVTTLGGRRRLLEHINSPSPNLAQQARRMAINAVVQGSAADIIKMAMIRTDQDPGLQALGARLILQVHDELLLEVPESTAREAGARLESIMETIYTLSVPLKVDWGCGSSWDAAH